MRFVVTYRDANQQKRIRFFKTIEEERNFVSFMRKTGSGIYSNFELKVLKY